MFPGVMLTYYMTIKKSDHSRAPVFLLPVFSFDQSEGNIPKYY